MAFVQKSSKKAIYAKFNASRGEFDVECGADTPGAVEYIVGKGENVGQKRYRSSYRALEGKLSAVTMKPDSFMGQDSLDVNMAFDDLDPKNPTIVVTARLMGGENGAVSQATLGWLESLNKADLSQGLSLSVAHNAVGDKFTAKGADGKDVEVVREFASSTVFVRHQGADVKDFIQDDRKTRPAVEPVKNKAGDKVIAKDYSEQLTYAKALVTELAAKADTQRNHAKELLKAASTNVEADAALVFGAEDGPSA